eukprot:NODE_3868_length_1970_cov_12.623440.p1 GENE.NODE_3868_length_1970_cov_12.623440~~NODE_3868_length_1970_cov_12.623440.p1  ORF type:complete len:641 (-),score=112.68 NODE_3868_length_1970_cov_12.623440:48-1850(-)
MEVFNRRDEPEVAVDLSRDRIRRAAASPDSTPVMAAMSTATKFLAVGEGHIHSSESSCEDMAGEASGIGEQVAYALEEARPDAAVKAELARLRTKVEEGEAQQRAMEVMLAQVREDLCRMVCQQGHALELEFRKLWSQEEWHRTTSMGMLSSRIDTLERAWGPKPPNLIDTSPPSRFVEDLRGSGGSDANISEEQPESYASKVTIATVPGFGKGMQEADGQTEGTPTALHLYEGSSVPLSKQPMECRRVPIDDPVQGLSSVKAEVSAMPAASCLPSWAKDSLQLTALTHVLPPSANASASLSLGLTSHDLSSGLRPPMASVSDRLTATMPKTRAARASSVPSLVLPLRKAQTSTCTASLVATLPTGSIAAQRRPTPRALHKPQQDASCAEPALSAVPQEPQVSTCRSNPGPSPKVSATPWMISRELACTERSAQVHTSAIALRRKSPPPRIPVGPPTHTIWGWSTPRKSTNQGILSAVPAETFPMSRTQHVREPTVLPPAAEASVSIGGASSTAISGLASIGSTRVYGSSNVATPTATTHVRANAAAVTPITGAGSAVISTIGATSRADIRGMTAPANGSPSASFMVWRQSVPPIVIPRL